MTNIYPDTPTRCQEKNCTNTWSAISITGNSSFFRCWYHWLLYYTDKIK